MTIGDKQWQKMSRAQRVHWLKNKIAFHESMLRVASPLDAYWLDQYRKALKRYERAQEVTP